MKGRLASKMYLPFIPFIVILCFASCKQSQEMHPNAVKPDFVQKNVFGTQLKICSQQPMTGFYRDGYCNSKLDDIGIHTVCVTLTQDFLDFLKQNGNDLTQPKPNSSFPGLQRNDRWCVCADWWELADEQEIEVPIDLAATNIRTLNHVATERLEKYGLSPQIY